MNNLSFDLSPSKLYRKSNKSVSFVEFLNQYNFINATGNLSDANAFFAKYEIGNSPKVGKINKSTVSADGTMSSVIKTMDIKKEIKKQENLFTTKEKVGFAALLAGVFIISYKILE